MNILESHNFEYNKEEYTKEEQLMISMLESVIAYASDYKNMEEILANRHIKDYMRKYNISRERTIELAQEIIDDIVEIKKDVYTDSEGVTYNQVNYKNHALSTGFSFKREDLEKVKELVKKHNLENEAKILSPNRFSIQTVTFDLVDDKGNYNRKLDKRADELFKELKNALTESADNFRSNCSLNEDDNIKNDKDDMKSRLDRYCASQDNKNVNEDKTSKINHSNKPKRFIK